jgi:hypothetical protein
MTDKSNIREREFTGKETEVIGELSKHMQFVGTFFLVLGLLIGLGGFFTWQLDSDLGSGLLGIVQGVLIFFAALSTNNAADSFRAIAKERGNDIKNLMIGFKEVRRIYEIQGWAISVSAISAIYLVVGMIVEIIFSFPEISS